MPSPDPNASARPEIATIPAVVTAADIQSILGISRPTAYQVLDQLPAIHVGRLRRALGSDFLAWLEGQREVTS